MKRIIDNKTGMFIRDDFTVRDGETALNVAPAQGFYWPKWDGKQWIEGRTLSEIAAIKAAAVLAEPTDKERIDLLVAENVALKERLAKIEAVPIVKTALAAPIIK